MTEKTMLQTIIFKKHAVIWLLFKTLHKILTNPKHYTNIGFFGSSEFSVVYFKCVFPLRAEVQWIKNTFNYCLGKGGDMFLIIISSSSHSIKGNSIIINEKCKND